MGNSKLFRYMKRGRVSSVFWGIALSLFMFSCSQNPIAVDERHPREAAASEQTVIHQIVPPPANWNGDLVVYAHGYVPIVVPLAIPAEAAQFATMAMSDGYAFATTSYPANGMAVPEALADLITLVNEFKTTYPETKKVLILGVSMGGLVAIQAAEKYPAIFNGVLAMSGIYGDFILETTHVGNFRTIFDYFFPGVIPGDAVTVATKTMIDWQTVYVPQVVSALSDPANADKVRQLLAVTKLPVNTADPQAIIESMIHILTLQVYATEDIKLRLRGNPFENRFMRYFGSNDDKALNAGVKRFKAAAAAFVVASTVYGTTGKLMVPAVTLHSSGDHVVPITNQLLYGIKVMFAKKTCLYTGITVTGFGHVQFDQQQIQSAFATLAAKVAAASNAPTPPHKKNGKYRE